MSNQEYLSMTALPETLERGLLKVPLGVLCAKAGWSLASDKYVPIQWMAKNLTHAAIRDFLAEVPQEAAKPIGEVSDVRVANGALKATIVATLPKRKVKIEPETLVKRATGTTRIQEGSLRAQVLAALAPGKTWSVASLDLLCKFPTKPVLAKLHAAGWVTFEEVK